MKKIASFTIDHTILPKGMYLSRTDANTVTYDIRTRRPNVEDVMSNGAIHTLEHLFATFVRNSDVADKIVYFGPMGCRTGFYLLLAGDYKSQDIVELIKEMFVFIRDYHDEVPGASAKDCGNYLDMNLPMANFIANKFIVEVLDNIDDSRLVYPD